MGRLQRDDDAEGRLFRGFAEKGHYGGRSRPTATRQGIYAVTPDGRFLASCNTRSPERMLAMLEQALAAWGELPESNRSRLPADLARGLAGVRRFEDRRPADGLVLSVVSRDLPRSSPERGGDAREEDWRRRAWNLDWAWFDRDESASLVPDATPGARRRWPASLVRRLAAVHLIDNVRGQVPAFADDEVREARLLSVVLGVGEETLELAFRGRVVTSAAGRWAVDGSGSEPLAETRRGCRLRLSGRGVWDRGLGRFRSFTLVAAGTRWGGTRYNARADDLAEAPIGFLIERVDPAAVPAVAPAAWWRY